MGRGSDQFRHALGIGRTVNLVVGFDPRAGRRYPLKYRGFPACFPSSTRTPARSIAPHRIFFAPGRDTANARSTSDTLGSMSPG